MGRLRFRNTTREQDSLAKEELEILKSTYQQDFLTQRGDYRLAAKTRSYHQEDSRWLRRWKQHDLATQALGGRRQERTA